MKQTKQKLPLYFVREVNASVLTTFNERVAYIRFIIKHRRADGELPNIEANRVR